MMTREEKAKIAQLYAVTAAYFRSQIPDEVLKLYAEDLSDLDYEEATNAINAYRKDPKNRTVPLPSQIMLICRPQTDPLAYGREVAGRIVKAIGLYGWPQPGRARAYIGEEGWQVIEEKGGWTHFCQDHGVNIDPGQFAAQARDRIADQVAKKGIQPRVVELVAPERPQLAEPKREGFATMSDANRELLERLQQQRRQRLDDENNAPGPA